MNKKVAGLCQCCLLLVALWQPPIVLAEEQPSIDCTVKPYQGKLFTKLYETTEKTAKTFCKELIRSRVDRNVVDDAFIGSILQDFAAVSEQSLDDLALKNSADYTDQFNALKRTFGDFDFGNMVMPEFKVQSAITGGTQGFFEPLEENTARFTINEVAQCGTISPGSSCKEIFRDFGLAFNPYRSAYDNVNDNTKQLTAMGKRWDEFLEVSKSQTVVEVFLTTWAQSGHFKKNHLVGPPSYQVIALHPHLVYNSMNKAPEGSKQQLGLAVEWLGVNFWDLSLGKFHLPLGISFASTYVDRANAKDVGHGAMLHIYNHYSVGFARHDDKNSVYITVDLLKMFEDKKAKYDKYVKRYF